METGLKLTQFILTGLVIIGWGKFFSLVLEVVFEILRDKIRNKIKNKR